MVRKVNTHNGCTINSTKHFYSFKEGTAFSASCWTSTAAPRLLALLSSELVPVPRHVPTWGQEGGENHHEGNSHFLEQENSVVRSEASEVENCFHVLRSLAVVLDLGGPATPKKHRSLPR